MFRLIPHRALSEPRAAVSNVREENGRSTATLRIEGLFCSACAANVERRLRGVDGVESAEVDLDSGEACAVFNAAAASPDALVRAVEGAGLLPTARRLLAALAHLPAGRALARQRQAEACPTKTVRR
jgi:copper chaperone CopZ